MIVIVVISNGGIMVENLVTVIMHSDKIMIIVITATQKIEEKSYSDYRNNMKIFLFSLYAVKLRRVMPTEQKNV